MEVDGIPTVKHIVPSYFFIVTKYFRLFVDLDCTKVRLAKCPDTV